MVHLALCGTEHQINKNILMHGHNLKTRNAQYFYSAAAAPAQYYERQNQEARQGNLILHSSGLSSERHLTLGILKGYLCKTEKLYLADNSTLVPIYLNKTKGNPRKSFEFFLCAGIEKERVQTFGAIKVLKSNVNAEAV